MLEASGSSSSGEEDVAQTVVSMSETNGSTLPSLMSLQVPPPPSIRAMDSIGSDSSSSRELHILVFAQPQGSNHCGTRELISSGSVQSHQSIRIYPGIYVYYSIRILNRYLPFQKKEKGGKKLFSGITLCLVCLL